MNNITFEDIINQNSELIYFYNKLGVPGRYLNKITCSAYDERPGIVVKLEINLTNIDNAADTNYTFWISNAGSLYNNNNPNSPQLNRVISAWLKNIRCNKNTKENKVKLMDCGILRQHSY